MRTLKFIVDGSTIKADPACSFNGLFPGAEDYIRAEFYFSKEWKNSVKVGAFWSVMGNEYEPQVIKEDNSCMIPTEALKRSSFRVQVLGKRAGTKMQTNKLTVYQKGGNA